MTTTTKLKAIIRSLPLTASCSLWTSNACLDRKTSRETQKKSAHLERSFLYSNKSNLGLGDIRMYRSSLPVEFEFTTLQLQMTAPQTRMNARGLFTTLFASLRL